MSRPEPAESNPIVAHVSPYLTSVERRTSLLAPWHWEANTTGHTMWLMTSGGTIVMDFTRWGMRGSQPRFNVQGVMRPALPLMGTPQKHNAWRKKGVDNPSAKLIAAAPLLLEALEAVHAWGDIDGDLRATVEKALKEAGSLDK
jgi:hypothetical protein